MGIFDKIFLKRKRNNAAAQATAALAYANRGMSHAINGELDLAIENYDKAISLEPKLAVVYAKRGIAYDKKGDLDRAIQDFSQAISLDPKLAEVYVCRGISYREKGDLDHAIEDYGRAIALNPRDASAFGNRGSDYYKKDDFDRAIQDCSHAISLNPNAGNYVVRASAYHKKGDFDGAIQDYGKAISLDPNSALLYGARAAAYRRLGKNGLADADEKRAQELSNTRDDGDLSNAKVIFQCAPIQPPKGFDRIPLVDHAFDEFEERYPNRIIKAEIEVGRKELRIELWMRAASSDEFIAMRTSFEKALRRRQLLGPITDASRWQWQFGVESINAFFARMSRAIVKEHGPLTKAVFLNHYPKFEIEFRYADGTCIFSGKRAGNTDIHYLTLGYVGDGPSCAQSFLHEAGFDLSSDQIRDLRAGSTLEKVDGQVRISATG